MDIFPCRLEVEPHPCPYHDPGENGYCMEEETRCGFREKLLVQPAKAPEKPGQLTKKEKWFEQNCR